MYPAAEFVLRYSLLSAARPTNITLVLHEGATHPFAITASHTIIIVSCTWLFGGMVQVDIELLWYSACPGTKQPSPETSPAKFGQVVQNIKNMGNLQNVERQMDPSSKNFSEQVYFQSILKPSEGRRGSRRVWAF
jgi:hypothetical protein